jgi:hypothetical protein
MTSNRHYTDTVQKKQSDRTRKALCEALQRLTSQTINDGCHSTHMSTNIDLDAVVSQVQSKVDRDMLLYSCESALDCLLAMYEVGSIFSILTIPPSDFMQDKVQTFVQNVVIQVVERHLVRGLDKVFSPLKVNDLSDEDVLRVAAEPAPTRRRRHLLAERL